MNEEIVTGNHDTNGTESKKKRKPFLTWLFGFLIGCIASTVVVTIAVLLVSWVANSNNPIDKETRLKLTLLKTILASDYYEEITEEDYQNGLFKGLMSAANDPYTCYYTPEEFDSIYSDLEGNFQGVGAMLQMDTTIGYPFVVEFIDGGAAGESGEIAEGDFIVAVEGEDVYGQTLDEIVSKVRGEEGTYVTITFEGASGKYDVTLERRKIESPTVKVSDEGDGVWMITITEFDDVTTEQFRKALSEVYANNAKGLVIDLRGNPGGSVDVVCDICREILPKGLIVYTEDKNGQREEYLCDGTKEIQIPLAVLVDSASASAAEIMSGAVKDYGIGTLVGTKTYGKGIVQNIIPLADGSAVKLTTAKYYTPNGINIHKIGIDPDVEVKFDAEKYQENQYDNQKEEAVKIVKEKIKQ